MFSLLIHKKLTLMQEAVTPKGHYRYVLMEQSIMYGIQKIPKANAAEDYKQIRDPCTKY